MVARIQSDDVVVGRQIRENVLSEMFEEVFTKLAQTDTVAEAWRKYLKPDDIVGLKFNHSGAAKLSVTGSFAKLLVNSLIQAGWPPHQLVLAEVPPQLVGQFGTLPFRHGWTQRPVNFGNAQDHLALFLDQVTAIINIPFLKTHNIAGLTGCLKNLSHSMVQHPAQYHANGCSPYVADIVGLPQIRSKIRLNIMNALRVVFDKGPAAKANNIDNAGLIVMGADPVAVDAVGLDSLNVVRQERGLPPILMDAEHVPSIIDAAEKGLGYIDYRKIKRLTA